MPKMWYDIYSVISKEDDNKETISEKEFNRQIIADKKPYFMIYVYPQLKREYRKFIKSAKKSCQSQYNITLDELLGKTDRDEKQDEFVKWYYKKYPVSDENGVMNRLCHYVEQEFDGYLKSVKNKEYPYRELLVSENFDINTRGNPCLSKIKKLYNDFKERMQDISILANIERHSTEELNNIKFFIDEQFKRDCDEICISSEMQCDILLKLCYTNEQSKRFVWALCGEQIVENLLNKKGSYSYFLRDKDGNMEHGGHKHKKVYVKILRDLENKNNI